MLFKFRLPILFTGVVLLYNHTRMSNSFHKSLYADDSYIKSAPTNTANTLMRGEVGAYNARRGGKLHSGVDIVANISSNDKEVYAVFAVNNGKVAYAKMNGTDDTDYGFTVVIDHGNNKYSQYSHLAKNASYNIVKVGDDVTIGQRIGYLADLSTGEKSSGNVRQDVVKQYDKIQLHFECFDAQSTRSSTTTLSILKKNSTLIDPTAKLNSFGYGSF
jgi:murein DD-endopeptidase MepM/ murein hydrolase activator NlpD